MKQKRVSIEAFSDQVRVEIRRYWIDQTGELNGAAIRSALETYPIVFGIITTEPQWPTHLIKGDIDGLPYENDTWTAIPLNSLREVELIRDLVESEWGEAEVQRLSDYWKSIERGLSDGQYRLFSLAKN